MREGVHMRRKESYRKDKGIGLIYVILLIAILLLAVSILGPYLFVREVSRQKDVETLERIKAIRIAILGNHEIISKGLRSSFGYVGDMGGLPPILEYLALQQNPAPNPFPVSWNQTSWSVHSTGIGYGWRGPYLDDTYSGNWEFHAFVDAWGTKFQYVDNVGQTVIDPATVSFPVFIRSAGPDRTFGTADDINENTHPELCRINEDDVRAILRGYTYCVDGTPVQRDNIYVYWPTLALDGTVSISTGGPYDSFNTGQCPYDLTRFDCRYFETPTKIPIGIRKISIETYINQFACINGGGSLHDGSSGRMRWNLRGGSCGACIEYVPNSRNNYRAIACWGTRSIVEIQIRNVCSNPVTITSVSLNYTPDIFFDTVFFSTDNTYPRIGVGWDSYCAGGNYGSKGITYSLNFSGYFQRLGSWRWWSVSQCSPTSFTIPGGGTGWISFGYFVDDNEYCMDIRNTAFTITLSDGSVLTIPP